MKTILCITAILFEVFGLHAGEINIAVNAGTGISFVRKNKKYLLTRWAQDKSVTQVIYPGANAELLVDFRVFKKDTRKIYCGFGIGYTYNSYALKWISGANSDIISYLRRYDQDVTLFLKLGYEIKGVVISLKPVLHFPARLSEDIYAEQNGVYAFDGRNVKITNRISRFGQDDAVKFSLQLSAGYKFLVKQRFVISPYVAYSLGLGYYDTYDMGVLRPPLNSAVDCLNIGIGFGYVVKTKIRGGYSASRRHGND